MITDHSTSYATWLIDCSLFVGVEIVFEAETITIRAMFLAYTVDLQAKAIILEMIAHNGYCSCSYCHDPGHAPKNEKGRRQHAYAFDGKGSLRTKEQWRSDAQKAVRTGKMVQWSISNTS